MLDSFEQENERLKKLYSLNILDSQPEDEYDRITQLAARRFNVPIALVTFLDKDQQWFKSTHGVKLGQVPRKASLCNEVLLNGSPCTIPDALSDDTLRKIVTHPVYLKPVRFYAGYPLNTKDGYTVGSFCIADLKPNYKFSEEDKKDLEVMAQMVMKLMSQKRSSTTTH